MCLLLKRNKRRSRTSQAGAATSSSSFWNRQTTLLSQYRPRTPIWTGWEVVNADGSQGSRASRNGGRESPPHSPGEGSPRGSGEEADPFLTRRSLRSATLADETQTKSDTLVSMPAAAVVGSTATSSPRSQRQDRHIVPRDVLARMAESESSQYDIRVVQPSPPQDHSPLLPPPPLDPDGLGVIGSTRPVSDRSLASQHDRSVYSEKSAGSLEADPAELLVARRVRVGDFASTPSPRITTLDPAGEPSTSRRSALGLTGLGARLGRLSWFKRLSSSGSPAQTEAGADTMVDTYTRSPPRSVRSSHSRPGSWTRLMNEPDVEAAPLPASSTRRDSGLGLGLLTIGSRPISSVSARSGNTVYESARSRPASSIIDFPEPVTSSILQEELTHSPPGENAAFRGPPPSYNDGQNVLSGWAEHPPSEIDILDSPAPGPLPSFNTGRPVFPPGLSALPRSWRDSYTTDGVSSGEAVRIEDEPPSANDGWRDLAGERVGRRRTFGVVRDSNERLSSRV